MSLNILSPKHGGAGRSKSFDDSTVGPGNKRSRLTANKYKAVLLFVISFNGFQCPHILALSETQAKSISATAALRCTQKLERLCHTERNAYGIDDPHYRRGNKFWPKSEFRFEISIMPDEYEDGV